MATVNVISQVLVVVVNVILARILLPEHFGLIALATTYIGFINVFSNVGFGSAIINKQESTQNQLSSIYWLNYVFAILSFLIVVSSVSIAANFYNTPELKYVVWLAAINMLLNPIFIPLYRIKERDLEFVLLSKISLTATIVGSVAAIIGAYLGFGVYALVLQILVSTMARLILVLSNSDWKPKLEFNYNGIRHMVWYSIKYKAADAIFYIERNIDYLILGKIFSSAIIGYYAFAYNIMYSPIKRISYIFSDILFPSFSSIQKDKSKIITGYFKSIQLIAMVTFPAMILLSYNAEYIIQTVFGNKWNEAIPIVEILCFAGAIQSISQIGTVIFPSIGYPETSLYIALGRTVLTVSAIIIGSFHGILYVAYFIVVAKILSYALLLIVLYFYIPFSILELIKYLFGSLLSVAIISILNTVQIKFNFIPNPLHSLIIMTIVASVIILIFYFDTIAEIIGILRSKTN